MQQPSIIFEDQSLIVLEKPSGWITNDASTVKNQPTIQTWVRLNHKSEITNCREFRDGIVHRLDKDTSGILIVAKTKKAYVNLQKQFKERLVKKKYIALVHGEVKVPEGVINANVGRLPWRRDRFGVLPGGRRAVTHYRTITYYRHPATKEIFTLVEFNPETGRTHQIRIHAKSLGHPIVGDVFYAGRKQSRKDRQWCNDLFLQAAGIEFIHPGNHKKVSFVLDLNKTLKKCLESLVKIN